jgi:hypothetical protein
MKYFLRIKDIDELIKFVCGETSYEIVEPAITHLSDEDANKIVQQVSENIENKYKDFILGFIKDTFSDDNDIYTFYKHSERNGGGKGFNESIFGWDKFLERFGSWFPDLNWSGIKEKLNSLPRGKKLLLKKPLEGHDFEYYFSVSKLK